MLVLSRKRGEGIVIGDRIRVTVGCFTRGRVCLVIDAPEQVSVDRDEVWRRKHEDNSLETADSPAWPVCLPQPECPGGSEAESARDAQSPVVSGTD